MQVQDAAGAWVDAGPETVVPIPAEGAPVVAVELAPTTTSAVRVVLTARPNSHMTISEIEVLALAPGSSSDARANALTVDGTPIAGFDPEVTAYTATSRSARPVVDVETADPYASVVVTQASGSVRTASVTVTSEDGTQSRTYTVAFPRR